GVEACRLFKRAANLMRVQNLAFNCKLQQSQPDHGMSFPGVRKLRAARRSRQQYHRQEILQREHGLCPSCPDGKHFFWAVDGHCSIRVLSASRVVLTYSEEMWRIRSFYELQGLCRLTFLKGF